MKLLSSVKEGGVLTILVKGNWHGRGISITFELLKNPHSQVLQLTLNSLNHKTVVIFRPEIVNYLYFSGFTQLFSYHMKQQTTLSLTIDIG